METVTLNAPDISCGHCVATVQDAVGKIEGVEVVTASAETRKVAVQYDASRTNLEDISKALEDAGYPANG